MLGKSILTAQGDVEEVGITSGLQLSELVGAGSWVMMIDGLNTGMGYKSAKLVF